MTWLARRRERRQQIRQAAIRAWARAEMERTMALPCERPSCYDGPDVIASRLEHGCIPDWNRPI